MTTPAIAEHAARLPWRRQLAPRCAAGSAVLRRLLDGHGPDEVAASMSAVAPVAVDRARQDVQALIDSLTAARLLEVSR
ncbi:PqqD family peptide modification chaperone [Streptomyces sp. NPDC102406]|uniref:PqqD family peptide modification chaperone n=1 Tax=Streptomyces sp. NPDC102406 TaxID=3366171 RepID=UPI0037FCC1F7